MLTVCMHAYGILAAVWVMYSFNFGPARIALLIGFGLVTLAVGGISYMPLSDDMSGFVVGCVAATAIVLTLGAVSHYNSRHSSRTQKQRLVRSGGSANRSLAASWYVLGLLLVITAVARAGLSPYPLVVGACGAACTLMGVLLLLDARWIHGIFPWNWPDAKVRTAWRGK
jgi:hypothetical protein